MAWWISCTVQLTQHIRLLAILYHFRCLITSLGFGFVLHVGSFWSYTVFFPPRILPFLSCWLPAVLLVTLWRQNFRHLSWECLVSSGLFSRLSRWEDLLFWWWKHHVLGRLVLLFHHILFYLDEAVSVKQSITVLPMCCQLVYWTGLFSGKWTLNFPEWYIYVSFLLHLLCSVRFRFS